MDNIKFDYEHEEVTKPLTVTALLNWIQELHTEMSDLGLLPGKISTQTHQELMILAQYEA